GGAPVKKRPRWKRILKWLALACGSALTLVVLALIFKNALIKAYAEHRIKSKTGLIAKIDELEVGLTTGRVWLKDLRIFNTAEFGGSVFLHVPEIYLELEPADSGKGRLHLREVRFNLS